MKLLVVHRLTSSYNIHFVSAQVFTSIFFGGEELSQREAVEEHLIPGVPDNLEGS